MYCERMTFRQDRLAHVTSNSESCNPTLPFSAFPPTDHRICFKILFFQVYVLVCHKYSI